MMIHEISSTQTRLASNLRRLRIARHLSLSQLARDTSMSKATLSGIEGGRGNPTVDTLSVLADALGVPIAELLQEAPAGEVRIVRLAQKSPWPPESGVGERVLENLPQLSGSLEVFELALAPHEVHRYKPRAEGSREAVLVIQGKLIAGPVERISELGGGDYASFPTNAAYLYEAGRAPARALVLRYTPT